MTIRAVQQAFHPEWAVALLARLMCRTSGREDEASMERELDLCASLGQFRLHLDSGTGRLFGLFAWLRGSEAICDEHFVGGSIDSILTVPRDNLSNGPHLMIVAILAIPPLSAYKMVRETTLWPGVERICGWRMRHGLHLAHPKVRREARTVVQPDL